MKKKAYIYYLKKKKTKRVYISFLILEKIFLIPRAPCKNIAGSIIS